MRCQTRKLAVIVDMGMAQRLLPWLHCNSGNKPHQPMPSRINLRSSVGMHEFESRLLADMKAERLEGAGVGGEAVLLLQGGPRAPQVLPQRRAQHATVPHLWGFSKMCKANSVEKSRLM